MKKMIKQLLSVFLVIAILASCVPFAQALLVENADGTYAGILENYKIDVSTLGKYVSKITVNGTELNVKKKLILKTTALDYIDKAVVLVVYNGEVTQLSLLSDLTTYPTISIKNIWDSNNEKKRQEINKITYSNGSFDTSYIYLNIILKNMFSSQNGYDYEFFKNNNLLNLEDITVTLKSSDENLLYFKIYTDPIFYYKSETITLTLDEIIAAGEEYEFTQKVCLKIEKSLR